jgi:hypothetical protein
VSTFDPMAAAIDWFDAYRATSLSIVDLYASDAVVECGCGMMVVCGRAAITGYWLQRFADKPAGELLQLQHNDGDGIAISYRVPDGLVQATLYFDYDGKIARSICSPTAEAVVLH